jgi:5'-3' exonuclease
MACDWLLIDGPSLIFRAYYGTLRRTAAQDGRRANAVGSFLDRLARLIVQRRPRQLAVTEDRAWRPEWRVDLIATYKAHRTVEPVPPALAPQIPVIYEILASIGIDVVGADDYEAEDAIASLANLASGTIEIVSGDRDLFALVEDPRVHVLYPEKAGLTVIDEGEVARRYGIPGRRYADFAILRGDPSDGLPGLKGIGSVGAAAMIRRYGDIRGVLRERRLTESDRDYLTRALRVVSPVDSLPIALPRGRRDAYPVDASRMESLIERYAVREPCQRLVDVVALVGASAPSAS